MSLSISLRDHALKLKFASLEADFFIRELEVFDPLEDPLHYLRIVVAHKCFENLGLMRNAAKPLRAQSCHEKSLNNVRESHLFDL
jgi:hypothetical protein